MTYTLDLGVIFNNGFLLFRASVGKLSNRLEVLYGPYITQDLAGTPVWGLFYQLNCICSLKLYFFSCDLPLLATWEWLYLPRRVLSSYTSQQLPSQYGGIWPLSFDPQWEGPELVRLQRRPKQGLSLLTDLRLMYHFKVTISHQEPNPIINLPAQTSLSRPWLLSAVRKRNILLCHMIFSLHDPMRESYRGSRDVTQSRVLYLQGVLETRRMRELKPQQSDDYL
jgi:hypothetical protein